MNTSRVPANPPGIGTGSLKQLLRMLLDALFGARNAPDDFSLDPFNRRDADAVVCEPSPDTQRQDARTLQQAFYDDFQTNVAALLRELADLHQYDPLAVYQVRAVILTPEVAAGGSQQALLAYLSSLNIDIRTRLFQALITKVPRASELLDLSNFYGARIKAEPTVLEGQVQRVLVSHRGSSFPLKVKFEGVHITRTQPLPTSDAAEPERTSTAATPAEINLPRPAANPTLSRDVPRTDINLRRANPVPAAAMLLQIRYSDNKLHTIPLQFDDLPYAIGRGPTGRGFALLADGGSDNEKVRYVGTHHLTIDFYDPLTRQCYLQNPGGTNGTWLGEEQVQDPRFLYDLGRWLCLGGDQPGPGVVEIRLVNQE